MAKFVSVNDKLPDGYARVIAYCDNTEMVWLGFYDDGEWITPDFENNIIGVTHWMEIDEYPWGGEDEQWV